MLTVSKTTYEIWDEDTDEILIDNLSFDDAAEQFLAYQQFFGDGVSVIIRTSCQARTRTTPRQEFKQAWFELMDELQAIGNLY